MSHPIAAAFVVCIAFVFLAKEDIALSVFLAAVSRVLSFFTVPSFVSGQADHGAC